MSSKNRKVIIIGGGVIGTASAYYLNQSGWDVQIIEKNKFASGCSHANCGYISPSHVLPLAVPGAITKTMKAFFGKNSPLYIRPRIDFTLLTWLMNFAKKCNRKDMLKAADGMVGLLKSSAELYKELLEKEPIDCEWQKLGLLFVYQDQHEFQEYESINKLLTEKYNTPADKIDSAALAEMEPALKEGMAGAWHYTCDTHVRPNLLMSSWGSLLKSSGVTITEDCSFESFVSSSNQASAIKTSQGELEADEFIIATGAWTPKLQNEIGTKIPIQPGKGYSLTMPHPEKGPKYPMILEESKVAITPMESGYRIGSTMEFSGYDDSLNEKRIAMIRRGAARYLKDPFGEPVEETWFGWRPMTYDNLPIIDRVPKFKNVTIAAGHNMLGLTLGTGTGKLVSEILNQQPPHVDLKPFQLSRF